jgi:glycosyltransferase involved in cell wall biosynthesis
VADIWPVWRASDIAVVPSTEPEPFGMVAIEAMACGLPVVAAAHGGLLDIVDDGRSGLLFTPRDADALAAALQRLAGDAALRQRLGSAGAQRQAEHFSLAAQVAQTRAAGLALMPA